MSIVSLILASLQPVLKVGLLCGAGAFCARKGLLSLEGRRTLSGLVFNLLVPCLFLDKLGSGPAGFAQAVQLWPLTFNMLATHLLGGLLGLALVVLVRPPAHLRNHMVLATMVGNTGNLPMVLVGSLGSDPALSWLGGAALGIQYIILANLTAAFFQFPFSIMLLRKDPADAAQQQQQQQEQQQGQEQAGGGVGKAGRLANKPALIITVAEPAGKEVGSDDEDEHGPGRPLLSANWGSANGSQSPALSTRPSSHVQLSSKLSSGSYTATTPGSYQPPQGLPSPGSERGGKAAAAGAAADAARLQPFHSVVSVEPLTKVAEESADDRASASLLGGWKARQASLQKQDAGPTLKGGLVSPSVAAAAPAVAAPAVSSQGTGWGAAVAAWWQGAKPMVTGVFSPPTVACVVALTIASMPDVQALFYSPTGALRLVGEAVRMFSDMAIPALMLVLGANLAHGPGVAKLPARLIVATVVCRLLILPLVGTAMVMAMKGLGLLANMQPIGIISMLVTHAVPTAIIVHSMATLFQNRQDDMAALLFWEYTACAITLPPLLALFLRLAM